MFKYCKNLYISFKNNCSFLKFIEILSVLRGNNWSTNIDVKLKVCEYFFLKINGANFEKVGVQ